MSASKFTPEVRGGLLERIAAGVSLADACRAVEIREKTVTGWITKGRREERGEYVDFVSAMEEARVAASSRSQPMDGDELAVVVSEMARRGSVQAAKLRWEMLRASKGNEEVPVDEFDELWERRRRVR